MPWGLCPTNEVFYMIFFSLMLDNKEFIFVASLLRFAFQKQGLGLAYPTYAEGQGSC